MKQVPLYLISILIFAAAFLGGCSLFGGDGYASVILNTSKGTTTYDVEVADTTDERTLGLMNRDSLDENKGMIFVYDKEVVPAFWMKNMEFPLDMIFFDKNLKVVDFFQNVPPCATDVCPHYIPSTGSQYILEVNSGTVNKLNVQRGDLAEYVQ